ncbi:MAG: ABC transporter ATP-binding protein [Desulfobacterales bacterium]|jgi:ATP-binding cassette subfamily B protein
MKSIALIKSYFKENRRKIAIGLLSLIVVDVLQLFIPRIIKWTVDGLTAIQIDLRQLLIYAIYMAIIAVLISMFRYVWRRCLLGTSRLVEEGLRNRLFAHIQTLSASYFDRTQTGDLMAHATNDIQQVRMATGMGMVALNDAIVLGAAAIGFMLYINVTLTLFVLIPMPLITIFTRFFSKKMHHRYQSVQATFSDLTEVIRERFAGIRIIKAHNRNARETEQVESVSKEYINENLSLVKIVGVFFPMMLLFTNLSLAIVLYLGGRQTIAMTITPGDFVAFISYLGLLTWPMMALGWVTNLIQRGRASLDRINRILETSPEIKNRYSAIALDHLQGRIEFKEVDFAYHHDGNGNGSIPVLSRINLVVEPGKVLGIVGPPGSGKTTLLSLIPRLYDVSRGGVFLDGKDIRSLKIENLRSHIAFMPQEPFLFAGTIRDNIAFDNPLIEQTRLEEISQKAMLDNTIHSFPNGFDTIVGEKGVILSGGQKQRIALARCLLKEAGILILDDPTSQVDLETGTAMIDTIRSMIGQKTIIIVSHRISALSFADEIIALEDGRIIEQGTHRDLITTQQYYAKAFQLQEYEAGVNAS